MENTETTILIVDDDEAFLDMIGKVVQSSGYSSVFAASGAEALKLLSKDSFSMILLETDLQGVDGFQVLWQARWQKPDIPIIVISRRTGDSDTVYGLDSGADDYIPKPFNPIVLRARIRALLRRSAAQTAEKVTDITVGPFTYNTATLRVYKNGTELPLTGKENVIMKVFMDNVNTLISKERLYDLIWGDTPVYDNSLMVYINRLRQKIEEDPKDPSYIQNIRGVGYRFTAG